MAPRRAIVVSKPLTPIREAIGWQLISSNRWHQSSVRVRLGFGAVSWSRTCVRAQTCMGGQPLEDCGRISLLSPHRRLCPSEARTEHLSVGLLSVGLAVTHEVAVALPCVAIAARRNDRTCDSERRMVPSGGGVDGYGQPAREGRGVRRPTAAGGPSCIRRERALRGRNDSMQAGAPIGARAVRGRPSDGWTAGRARGRLCGRCAGGCAGAARAVTFWPALLESSLSSCLGVCLLSLRLLVLSLSVVHCCSCR